MSHSQFRRVQTYTETCMGTVRSLRTPAPREMPQVIDGKGNDNIDGNDHNNDDDGNGNHKRSHPQEMPQAECVALVLPILQAKVDERRPWF